MKKIALLLSAIPFLVNAQVKWVENELTDGIKKIKVNNQITLGYSTSSGVKIITKDGLPFKDLNKNGTDRNYLSFWDYHGATYPMVGIASAALSDYTNPNHLPLQTCEHLS